MATVYLAGGRDQELVRGEIRVGGSWVYVTNAEIATVYATFGDEPEPRWEPAQDMSIAAADVDRIAWHDAD
jgi:hypothetical protein